MSKKLLGCLVQALRQRRRELLEEVAHTEEDLRFIAEDQESDLEERAQEERMGPAWLPCLMIGGERRLRKSMQP